MGSRMPDASHDPTVPPRVLVTGAQGWLGRFVSASFLMQDADVLGMGRSAATEASTVQARHGRYRYRPCDLLDTARLRSLLAEFQPTHIVHAAGATPGATAGELSRLNVEATRSLVEAIGERPSKLVLVSSGSVYGEAQYLPQDENHPIRPATDYAASKWRSEQAASEAAARPGDIEVVVARVFNLVGPGCPASLLPGSLAGQLAAVSMHLREPVIRMGPLTTVRDYVDVRDCAEAIRLLSMTPDDVGPVVNVASGRGVPVSEIWDRLLAIHGKSGGPAVEIAHLPPMPDNVRVQTGSTERLAKIGFRLGIGLERSLRDLYDGSLAAVRLAGEATSRRRGWSA